MYVIQIVETSGISYVENSCGWHVEVTALPENAEFFKDLSDAIKCIDDMINAKHSNWSDGTIGCSPDLRCILKLCPTNRKASAIIKVVHIDAPSWSECKVSVAASYSINVEEFEAKGTPPVVNVYRY